METSPVCIWISGFAQPDFTLRLPAPIGSDYEHAVILNLVFGSLACLSFALLLWQWTAGRRFPLHHRAPVGKEAPAITLLKSLKGFDAETENCLRSWFVQDYPGAVQILFGVASAEDPVCVIVQKLLREFPKADAQLLVCENLKGANAKVAKLARLTRLAKHELLAISDADVRVPADFLSNAVQPLVAGPQSESIGLVNCIYRLANPTTLAMRWEAVAINADFWSQVLQSKSMKPLDFALGAVMVTRRKCLDEIGGFEALADCLADDYQLGHRIARLGHRIELCSVVVECWHSPQTWAEVWKHQLRWARTIRVCQPAPYFFSILSNLTLWSLAWLAVCLRGTTLAGSAHARSILAEATIPVGAVVVLVFLAARVAAARDLERRLAGDSAPVGSAWLAPVKDVLQAAIWFFAFAGNTIEWRGRKFTLKSDGSLVER